MPAKSFFDLKTRAVPTRYSLSKNIQDLLIALDDFHNGSIDAVEIGRLVRLSPNRRAAIANTITKCANILKSQPMEVATCVDVIEMCTELLEIADNIFRTKSILPANNKIGNCKCPRFERDNTFQTSQMKDLTNIFGPNLITLEFFRVFFRTKTFRFRCPCELRTHLTNNGMFFDNVRKIVVQWSGPEAAMAFKQLKRVPKLKSLGIVISRLTYIHLNERSATMKNYFPLAYKNTRLSDILGLDELLEIRGLNLVEVMLAHSSRGGTQSHEMDRANLLELLSGRLTRPKGDDYDVELE
ncbi:hypothetical protein TrVFT333_004928 [Trichoderma virens FT-333]|nr:hypothetical protein TrVFT333_004928 [Trichoderma virens FT-333]